jgi:hypothetical protein
MENNITNIISNNPAIINDALLLKYSEGKATPEEQYAVEKYLNEAGLESDALEGINMVDNIQETTAITNNLKKHLHTITHKRKHNSHKKMLSYQGVIYLSIVLLIVLACLGYYFIKFKIK